MLGFCVKDVSLPCPEIQILCIFVNLSTHVFTFSTIQKFINLQKIEGRGWRDQSGSIALAV